MVLCSATCPWLDATYLKQRQGGRIVSVAAVVVVTANAAGRRGIIGLSVSQSAAAAFWIRVLKSLARRAPEGLHPQSQPPMRRLADVTLHFAGGLGGRRPNAA